MAMSDMPQAASRDLDYLIAEKVMGWKYARNAGAFYPPNLHPEQNVIGHEVPHYSTSIADAWRIVEKLSKQYQVTVSSPCDELRYWTVYLHHHGYRCFQDIKHEAESDISAPHAICLAALKAMAEEV